MSRKCLIILLKVHGKNDLLRLPIEINKRLFIDNDQPVVISIGWHRTTFRITQQKVVVKCLHWTKCGSEVFASAYCLLWMKRRLLIQKNNRQIIRSVIYQQIHKTFNEFGGFCSREHIESWHSVSFMVSVKDCIVIKQTQTVADRETCTGHWPKQLTRNMCLSSCIWRFWICMKQIQPVICHFIYQHDCVPRHPCRINSPVSEVWSIRAGDQHIEINLFFIWWMTTLSG